MLRHLTYLSTTIVLCAGSLAAQGTAVPYFSDFEANNGGFAGTFDWQWGTPVGVVGSTLPGGSGGAEPTGGFSGTNCWGTILGGLHSAGATSVLSQTFDLTGSSNTLLLFQEWIDSGGNTFDTAEVLVNGTQLYLSDGGPTTWRRVTLDLSAYDGMANVQVDFTFTTTTVVERVGWYIDDVRIDSGILASATARGAGCGGTAFAGTGGSIHEFFGGTLATPADPFDLPAGSSVAYSYIPGTGYGVMNGPAMAFDPMIGTQVVWNSGTGDDSLSTQALPFAFPLAGGATTSSIDVCSNGFVWLVSGSTTLTDFSPSSADFQTATNPARIAPLWTDFNNNPASTTGGGTIAFNATPAKATITWDQVPTFGNDPLIPANLSTVQLQLFPTGDFIIVYQSVGLGTAGIVGDEALIGYTIGNNTAQPAEIDYSTALPAPMMFAEVPSVPGTASLTHDADTPALGSTVQARATEVPSTTLAAVLHVGLDQTSVPLDAIGMTGCTAYTLLLAAVLPMTVNAAMNDASVSLGAVPNNPALVGGTFTTQAIALVPLINPLQLISSNGVDYVMGL